MKRATLLVSALLAAGCGPARHPAATAVPQGLDPREAGAATAQVLNNQIRDRPNSITVVRAGSGAGPVDLRPSSGFHASILAFEHETKAQRVRVIGLPGAAGFRVGHRDTDSSLDRWNQEYLKRGAYLIRYINTQGYSGGRDGLLMLPTRDQWTAIRAAAVSAAGYGLGTPAILQWLRQLDSVHSFRVYGVGADFVEGRFARPPSGQDGLLVARSMYRFDPDIVDQGAGTVDALAQLLQSSGTLYLWWD